jgi:hypothetical protein
MPARIHSAIWHWNFFNELPRGIKDRNPQEPRSKLRGIHHPAKAG